MVHYSQYYCVSLLAISLCLTQVAILLCFTQLAILLWLTTRSTIVFHYSQYYCVHYSQYYCVSLLAVLLCFTTRSAIVFYSSRNRHSSTVVIAAVRRSKSRRQKFVLAAMRGWQLEASSCKRLHDTGTSCRYSFKAKRWCCGKESSC